MVKTIDFGVIMKKLIVKGGRPLFGSVTAAGSKNASLPILFSSLITKDVSRIDNIPEIGDTVVALKILKSFGVEHRREGKTLFVDARNIHYATPDANLISKIRASTYLIGACLSAFGKCRIMDFGGCKFSPRPIDLHIDAAKALGARKLGDFLYTDKLVGAEINLSKPSVGATVNSLIMACSAEGESSIVGYAKEPHVLALIDFLRSMGADIRLSDDKILIKGTRLHGGNTSVIGDMIEAGTYLTAGLITGGEVEVVGVSAESMEPYLSLTWKMGAKLQAGKDRMRACAGEILSFGEVVAMPYPGFPTDLQPIIAPLFAKNSGGVIIDRVFPDRFEYLESLSSFGVSYKKIGSRYIIEGSKLKSSKSSAPCLRGGAALLLSALCQEGESVIENAELILRGYEDPVKKLRSLGADVELTD